MFKRIIVKPGSRLSLQNTIIDPSTGSWCGVRHRQRSGQDRA
jgi:hypothetical protein